MEEVIAILPVADIRVLTRDREFVAVISHGFQGTEVLELYQILRIPSLFASQLADFSSM